MFGQSSVRFIGDIPVYKRMYVRVHTYVHAPWKNGVRDQELRVVRVSVGAAGAGSQRTRKNLEGSVSPLNKGGYLS